MEKTKPVMIILRGQPGAGKSTIAKKCFPNYVICSADDHFMKNGKYVFDRYELQVAHDYCYVKAKKNLSEGRNVIVDNTNRKLDEFKRYMKFQDMGLTSEIIIYKVVSSYTSTKNVPDHVIKTFNTEYQIAPNEKHISMCMSGGICVHKSTS